MRTVSGLEKQTRIELGCVAEIILLTKPTRDIFFSVFHQGKDPKSLEIDEERSLKTLQ